MKLKQLLFTIPASCLMIVSAFCVNAGEKKQPKFSDAAPIIDFSDWTVSGNVMKDKSGNATIKMGETMKEGLGPFGGKAMEFDGLKTSVGQIDYSKVAAKLDGFDYSFACWIKGEFQDTKNQPRLSGNNPCGVLGLSAISEGGGFFQMRSVGPGGISKWFDMNSGEWNHVAVIYSLNQRIMYIYVNGYPITTTFNSGFFYPLVQNKSGIGQIGAFKGLIADLKVWDQPVSPDQFLNMQLPEKAVAAHREQIANLRKDAQGAAGMTTMCDTLTKQLDDFVAKKSFPVNDYNLFLQKLRIAKELLPYVVAFQKSTFKDAPFALLEAKAASPHIRIPTKFPRDVYASQELKVTASKDEYTESTFFIYPYKDLKKIEFELSDLKGPGGVIPKSEMELMFVQCWMQPGWNSYFNGSGNYVPSLLLHDPDLIRVDERTKINYLRLNYPSGTQYCNVCEWGSVLKHPRFDWAFEPAYDSDTLLPLPCEFGRNRQIWVEIHVPKDLKAGTYTGKIQLKAEGENVGYVNLNVKVLPFVLPLPKTQFDHKRDFTQFLWGNRQIKDLREELKDQKMAEDLAYRHLVNQKKHGIFDVNISLGDIDENGNCPDFEKYVEFMKKLDMPLRTVDGGGACDTLFPPGSKRLWEDVPDEEVRADFERMDKRAQQLLDMAKKYNIDPGNIYCTGIDEAQSAGSLRIQSPYRRYLHSRGMKSLSTGWEDNYRNLPSFESYHTTAAFIDRRNAERWHAIGCEISAYAIPFTGPDNPDLMRRTHGMKLYRNNYDSFTELAYNSDRYHTWNDHFGYDTTYRNFRFIVSTMKGPIINTVAFCGFRAGQYDVRYASFMNQLIDECYESGKIENVIAGREAQLWFRNLDFPVPADLDAVRDGMNHHILKMMKLLGKNMQ